MIEIKDQAQLDTLKYESDALLVLFGGAHCNVCQTIKPQIFEKFREKFQDLQMVYIDCELLQDVCAQHGVFSLPVVQVFFMGQKFIEEIRGFSLVVLEREIEKIYAKMNG